MKPLTSKQAKFAEVYDGNGTESVRRAGYKGSENTLAQVARQNLRNPQIQKAIAERQQAELAGAIATRKERQMFWTLLMRDDLADLSARLKASELLGKSEADFVDRHEVKATVSYEELVLQSLKQPSPSEPPKAGGA